MKGWLGKGGKQKQSANSGAEEMTVQDLITLRRYDDAEEMLLEAIRKDPRDLRSRRLLGDLYIEVGRQTEAVEEFAKVVTALAYDGFHDRALALLAKLRKQVPGEDRAIGLKMEEVLASKRSESLRIQIRDIFAEDLARRGTARGALALEVDRCWKSLARWDVLDSLTGEQLRRLFSGFQMVKFKPGEWLVRKGGTLERLLVILDGEIEVVSGAGEETRTVVHAFSAGECIGEGGLLERLPWPADYRAKGVTTALSLERGGLERAIIGNSAPKELLDALRLRANDARIRDLMARIERE